jgi:hypothetical protein
MPKEMEKKFDARKGKLKSLFVSLIFYFEELLNNVIFVLYWYGLF